MEEITILKSNFIIGSENVMPALDALIKKYPELIEHLKQRTDQHKLQFAFYLLGYHTRIHNDGMMFGLRKLEKSSNLAIDIKYDEFFALLAPFTQQGSYVDLVVNGIEKTIILKELILKKENDVEQTRAPIPEVEEIIVKEINASVAAEIAKEIEPEVLRIEERTMADIVAEAIKKADESLKEEPKPDSNIKKKPGRKPRAKK